MNPRLIKSFLRNIILIVIIASFTCFVEGCTSFQKSKRQEAQRRKQFERDKKQKEKEAQEAYEEAIKRHYAIQDESTKKMMKQTAQLSQEKREHKKAGFFKRLFAPKQKKAKPNRAEK